MSAIEAERCKVCGLGCWIKGTVRVSCLFTAFVLFFWLLVDFIRGSDESLCLAVRV